MSSTKELSGVARAWVLLILFLSLVGCLGFVDEPDKTEFTMQVAVKEAGVIHIYWCDGDQQYSEKNKRSQPLGPGLNVVNFNIDSSYQFEKLGFALPGQAPELTLKSLILSWDDELVFDLRAQRLLSALKPIKDVSTSFKENVGVIVTPLGENPVFELPVSSYNSHFTFLRYLKCAGYAAVLTLLLSIPFWYLTSKRDLCRSVAYSLGSNKEWIYLGTTIFLVGLYITIALPVDLNRVWEGTHAIFSAYVIGFLVFIVGYWFLTRQQTKVLQKECGQMSWLFYALPAIAVWTLFLLAFFPGCMSPDSLSQWKQVLTGNYKDWHPAFHSLSMWLITRTNLSPATMVIFQIMLVALVVAGSLQIFCRLGVPKKILWLCSFLIAIIPVNGFLVTTVWKDIFYSISLYALTVMVLLIVVSKGKWVAKSSSWMLLGVGLFFVCIYRHNGFIPAILVATFLVCSYFRFWPGVLKAAVLAVFLLFIVKGPLYNYLDVKRGTPLTSVYKKVKSSFDKKKNGGISVQIETKREVPRKTDSLSDNIRIRLLSSSLLWRVYPLQDYYGRVDYGNIWSKRNSDGIKEIRYVSSNKLGLEEQSLLPSLRDRLYLVYENSKNNMFFWIWRPAFYLYAFLFSLSIFALRVRDPRVLGVALPVLANSLPVLAFVSRSSIFRYHYSILLVSIVFTLSLLFVDTMKIRREENGQ